MRISTYCQKVDIANNATLGFIQQASALRAINIQAN